MFVSFEDRSVMRADGLDERAVVAAIDAGARVVLVDMVFSLLLLGFSGSRRYLVRSGESAVRISALPTLVTALGGWWGLGIFRTPFALHRNLTGGLDVTTTVRAELAAKVAEQDQRSADEAALHAAASAPHATSAVRRERVLTLLERGDALAAWSLVEADVSHQRGLARDIEVLRRLAPALRDKRAWSRAARVATLLRRDHPDAVQGYTAVVVDDALLHATQPDGWSKPMPLAAKALLAGLLLAFVIGAALVANAEVARSRGG